MRKITADIVFPIDKAPIKEGVVVLDEKDKIVSIDSRAEHRLEDLELYSGWITPGFINTHCHLELSHMKSMIETGTGLIPFITSVVKNRDIAQSVIDDAIKKADSEMTSAGIVAVGDISNKTDTAAVKSSSSIRYYTFIEMFDFMQDGMTQSTIDQYQKVFEGQSIEGTNKKNYVPHAPYSVSKNLFSFIRDNSSPGSTISIHSQETVDEDLLFLSKEGKFISFFEGFGMDMKDFKPTGKTSIHYAMENMDPNQKTLFVHNTMTMPEDIQMAHAWSDKVYWATCANANLYIENRLPRYQSFIDENAKMTIGTDSLSSNWQLCVLEEIKTIHKYQSHIPLDKLLQWATLNGAEALGFEDQLGSIAIGKCPGLNLIHGMDLGSQDLLNAKVQKLA